MPPGRINRKTSRLSFNWRVALNNKATCFDIYREVRQSAGRALAGVQVTPVRR